MFEVVQHYLCTNFFDKLKRGWSTQQIYMDREIHRNCKTTK